MNRYNTLSGFVRVDNGALCRASLVITTHVEEVVTIAGTPDPRWSAMDDGGHTHAYSVRGNHYPTLERHPIREPDGDGWAPSILRCVICKRQVTPGEIPGPTRTFMDGLAGWEVAVELGSGLPASMPEMGKKVTMFFSAHAGGVWFGVATVGSWRLSDDGARVHLRAVGELGRAAS